MNYSTTCIILALRNSFSFTWYDVNLGALYVSRFYNAFINRLESIFTFKQMHSSILVHSIARNIKAAVEDILFAMARLLLFPDGVIKLIYIFIDNFSLG